MKGYIVFGPRYGITIIDIIYNNKLVWFNKTLRCLLYNGAETV